MHCQGWGSDAWRCWRRCEKIEGGRIQSRLQPLCWTDCRQVQTSTCNAKPCCRSSFDGSRIGRLLVPPQIGDSTWTVVFLSSPLWCRLLLVCPISLSFAEFTVFDMVVVGFMAVISWLCLCTASWYVDILQLESLRGDFTMHWYAVCVLCCMEFFAVFAFFHAIPLCHNGILTFHQLLPSSRRVGLAFSFLA